MTPAKTTLPSISITLRLIDRSDVLLVHSDPEFERFALLKSKATTDSEIDLGFLVASELTKPIHRITVQVISSDGSPDPAAFASLAFESTFSTFDGRNAVALLLARGGWVKMHR